VGPTGGDGRVASPIMLVFRVQTEKSALFETRNEES
jgi:hypothetical protein